jgi:hypothetical protein
VPDLVSAFEDLGVHPLFTAVLGVPRSSVLHNALTDFACDASQALEGRYNAAWTPLDARAAEAEFCGECAWEDFRFAPYLPSLGEAEVTWPLASELRRFLELVKRFEHDQRPVMALTEAVLEGLFGVLGPFPSHDARVQRVLERARERIRSRPDDALRHLGVPLGSALTLVQAPVAHLPAFLEALLGTFALSEHLARVPVPLAEHLDRLEPGWRAARVDEPVPADVLEALVVLLGTGPGQLPTLGEALEVARAL